MTTPITKQNSSFLFDKLPIEMVENIIYYLPNDDLLNFSKTSTTYKQIAFSERSNRIFHQLGKISQKINSFIDNPADCPSTGNYGFIKWTLLHPSFPQEPTRLSNIKQALIAHLTNKVAEETKSLRQATLKRIEQGPEFYELEDLQSVADNSQKYLETEALRLLSRNIDTHSKEYLIVKTAQSGHLYALTSLLSDRTISQDIRSEALIKATFYGHLSLIKPLLENGPVSEAAISIALKRASMQGRLPEVQACLNAGLISDISISRALLCAVKGQHLCTTLEILAYGPILESYIIDAIIHASMNGNLPILEALFDKSPSLENKRSVALVAAAASGQFFVVKKILQSHNIPFKTKLRAAKAALSSRHYNITSHLLHLRPLVGALIMTLSIGSLKLCHQQLQEN